MDAGLSELSDTKSRLVTMLCSLTQRGSVILLIMVKDFHLSICLFVCLLIYNSLYCSFTSICHAGRLFPQTSVGTSTEVTPDLVFVLQ